MYADSIRVYPLDATGKENIQTSFIVKKSSINHFTVNFDQVKYKTLWFGIEKYGDKILPGIIHNADLPVKFGLEQNYPNPFNPETVINYKIQATSYVTLKVYDLLGREVATLVDEYKQPGEYNAQFAALNLPAGRQGSQFPSGIYLYT
jgi:hypothetical protein